MPSKKVVIVTNIPNPYRIPLFNELHGQLRIQEQELFVLFGAKSYSRRHWKIDMSECKFGFEILPSKTFDSKNPEKSLFTYSKLLSKISAIDPHVVIVIGFSLATVKLFIRSLYKRSPFLIWSGAIHRKNRPDSFLRKIQRHLLLRRARGFITYGTKAKDYLVSLGADEKKISIGINTVDTQFFYDQTKKIRSESNFKKSTMNLLSVGYVTQGKRLDLLLEIVKMLRSKRSDFHVYIVGTGPYLEEIKKTSRDLSLTEYITFTGYKQKNELPHYFALADCFLFPSEYDVWGLVLVEAMAAGIPCISSIFAGATSDVIRDGVTGYAMNFENCSDVANKINWIFDHEVEAREVGRNGSLFIQENVNLKKSAEGFVQAINRV